jgi:hypothetical protein
MKLTITSKVKLSELALLLSDLSKEGWCIKSITPEKKFDQRDGEYTTGAVVMELHMPGKSNVPEGVKIG